MISSACKTLTFAGLQGAAARREAGGELKHKAVADDALIRQQIADRADATFWQDHEHARFRQRAGTLGLAVKPIAARAKHRDDQAGGDHAPGDETEKPGHAHPGIMDSPCPAWCRAPTSFLAAAGSRFKTWMAGTSPAKGFWGDAVLSRSRRQRLGSTTRGNA
jgi:hypothetical protein